MEVQNKLNNRAFDSQSSSPYAVITRNKTGHEVWISDSPYYRVPWSEDISLKNVKYKITEGILYINGMQIYHYNFPNLLDLIEIWGNRSLWTINHKYNDKLVEPFVETDIYIKRWWRKNKKVRGVDLTDKVNIDIWYLSKEENECEIALSNFKLVERYNTEYDE